MLIRLLPLLGMAACTSLPTDNRSPEQIAAAAKDKSVTVTCAKTSTLTVSATVVNLTVDSTVLRHGGVEIDAKTCAVRLTNSLEP
jgi:carbohydrate-binding DOMON domain-containing protein